MAEHTATVRWQRGSDERFLDRRYQRAHTWHFDGGLQVPASASPHVVAPSLCDASAVDPEEAYIAALSSCHMLWFLDLASRAGWRVDAYSDTATAALTPDAQGRPVVSQVQLNPVTRFGAGSAPSLQQLQALHHEAHAACFLANSVKTRIDCAPVLQITGG